MADRERFLALVTGASSGIGRHIAHGLAGRGYDLVVCAEDAQLDATAQEFRSSGADVTPVRVDLRAPQEVEPLMRRVLLAVGTRAIHHHRSITVPESPFADADSRHALSATSTCGE